jgi:signal transduction histidine kinase
VTSINRLGFKQLDSDEFRDTSFDQGRLDNRPFLGDLQSLSTRIAAVQEISTSINRSLKLDEILKVVGQQAKWVLDFDQCSVCLCDRLSRRLVTLFGSPVPDAEIEASSPLDRAIQTKQPQIIRDRATTQADAAYRSHIIIPLESEDQVLGTINFALRQENGYSQEDVRIAYLLALQVAAAMRNAQRFEEMNRLYAELQHTHTQLKQAQGFRDELMHMIVHDLRNPLSSINISLDMISMMATDPDEQLHWLELANVASQTMTGMIDDLLNLNKLEAGKLKLILRPLQIGTLMLGKYESYAVRAVGEHKTVTLELPDDLPSLLMDVELIGRVLDNLVSNAFKYTHPGGQIEISARADETYLFVYVRDDGLGLPPEYRDRIFDKFVQVTDASGASLRKGIGLGLAFCRMAIEAHGGKIWVDSTLEQGSTFAFTLPLSLG